MLLMSCVLRRSLKRRQSRASRGGCACNQYGRTAVHWAARCGSIECGSHLIDRAPGLIEAVDNVRCVCVGGGLTAVVAQEGWNALHIAASNGHASFVEWLLDRCPQLVERVTNVRVAWLCVALSAAIACRTD